MSGWLLELQCPLVSEQLDVRFRAHDSLGGKTPELKLFLISLIAWY